MKKTLLALIIAATFTACSKDPETENPNPSPVIDDARTVLLKDVVAERLPDPYFHFTYDSLHYVKQISFASELAVYTVEYENKRVRRMTNVRNGNRMEYTYSAGRVAEITELSGINGKKKFRYQFNYNYEGQLTEALWYNFFSDDSSTVYKKSVLAYQPDGNLASIDKFYNTTGKLVWSSRSQFSGYDAKTNVDDFYLLEDFFDTFLFLPQVKFQKNNPTREFITSAVNDYDISYQYQYQGDLPVNRTGAVNQTRGTDKMETVQIRNRYSYY